MALRSVLHPLYQLGGRPHGPFEHGFHCVDEAREFGLMCEVMGGIPFKIGDDLMIPR